MSDIYQFADQDSNLDNAFEWFSATTGMSGTVPGPTDAAIIGYGQSLTGTLDVATLVLSQASGGPSLSLTGASTQVTASAIVVGGTAVLDSGAGLTVDTLELTGGGTALVLQNGASVFGNSPDAASATIGTTSGASLLSIAGIDTSFEYTSAGGSLLVGDAASSSATVSVTGGGAFAGAYADVLIGAADGAMATMLVSGPASLVELDGLVEIGDRGTGSLVIQKGGYASLGVGEAVIVGNTDDGSMASGNVTVTGAGSLLSVGGELVVGQAEASIGQVLVSAGGQAQVSGDTYVEDGLLSVVGAGTLFEGRAVEVDATSGSPAVSLSNGGSASIVTLHLNSGRVSLAGGNLTVRRSDFISSGATLSGAGIVTAGVNHNNGLLSASGGTLRFIGAVDQAGAAHIGAAATLQFDDAVGSGQTVTFEAATGTLALGDASGFAGTVAGFGQGETIDLLDDAATGLSLKAGVLTVKDGGATVAHLALKGAHKAADFTLASDGHGGTQIAYLAGQVIGLPVQGWHAFG